MELLCSTNQEENSDESADVANDNGAPNLPQGPHSGSSAGDHEDHDSPIGPYLTPTESKLFATAAGSFNFSMAALAADPTGLGGESRNWFRFVFHLVLSEEDYTCLELMASSSIDSIKVGFWRSARYSPTLANNNCPNVGDV